MNANNEDITLAEMFCLNPYEYANVSLFTLPFSIRVLNRFEQLRMLTVKDMLSAEVSFLRKIPGFGAGCMSQVYKYCEQLTQREAELGKKEIREVFQLLASEKARVSRGDFSFVSNELLSENQKKVLLKIEEGYSLLGEDLVNECINSPDHIAPILFATNQFNDRKNKSEKLADLLKQIPEERKHNCFKYYLDAFSKRKGSEVIAGKLLQEKWQEALTEYAAKAFQNVYTDIGSDGVLKAIKENGIITQDSGAHASRRYLSMMDAVRLISNSLSIDEEMFKNENITSGNRNIEHFIINREHKYALYLSDSTVDVEISLKKNRRYMAALVNYLIIDSDINRGLMNRPVYEKIEIIENLIETKRIELIIPSEESRKHYYVIKQYLHDESKYPANKLRVMSKKKEKMAELRQYYNTYFAEELLNVARDISNPDKLYSAEMTYKLKKIGFSIEDGTLSYNGIIPSFANVRADVDEKRRIIWASCEVFNPYYASGDAPEKYDEHVSRVCTRLTDLMGMEPEIHSSKEYCDCEDESVTFVFGIDSIDSVVQFLGCLQTISSEFDLSEQVSDVNTD